MPDCLVRGLKAPRRCSECNNDLAAAVHCIYTQRLVLPEEHDMRSGRHPSCPIVQLPLSRGRVFILPASDGNDLPPIKPEIRTAGAGGPDLLICPACCNIIGNRVMSRAVHHYNRCERCGQQIDWSDWEPGCGTGQEEGETK